MNREATRIVFMGSAAFALPALQSLVGSGYSIAGVYTQPDREAGRGRRLVAPPVKALAVRLGLPVYQADSLRSPRAIEELRELAPDLIVVAAYGQILRHGVLEMPRHGCLNIHASLLPRHRGAAPVAAAILAGDAETGVTIMQIDAGLDTGPTVTRRSTPILDSDTTGSLTARLADLGAALLRDTLPNWLAGELSTQPQDERRATLAPSLRKQDAEIDWNKPASQLWREIRAYNPWPLSFTRFRGESVQILEAAQAAPVSEPHAEAPGSVIDLRDAALELEGGERARAGFAVVTGAGLLVPLLLRREGRKAVTGAEFARGTRELIGSRFD